jgi:acetyl esterase/lipase
MPRLIRRTLLVTGLAATAGAAVLWRSQGPRGPIDDSYGDAPDQSLDITAPGGLAPASPVLVIFHDGLFSGGDKADVPVWPEFAEASVAVVRVNVRRAEQAVWPAQADDALAAIVHLQRHGPDMDPPIDPSRMVLMGQGAGAYLALTTALSLVEVGLRPRGVISLYGPVDFSTLDADMATLGRASLRGPADEAGSPESRLLGFAIAENRPAARAASPLARLARLREPLPPLLIRHGDADAVVADPQAMRLREAWLAADPDAQIDYKLVPGAGHGGEAFETGSVRADILAFVMGALA